MHSIDTAKLYVSSYRAVVLFKIVIPSSPKSTSRSLSRYLVLSSFISSSQFFHFSFLLTTSRIPSWPSLNLISTFLTLCTLIIPSILRTTLICVAWTLDSCYFDRFHTSHPYTNMGNMVAFMTFNLVFLISSFLWSTATLILQSFLLHFLSLLQLPSPYSYRCWSSHPDISFYRPVLFPYHLFQLRNVPSISAPSSLSSSFNSLSTPIC